MIERQTVPLRLVTQTDETVTSIPTELAGIRSTPAGLEYLLEKQGGDAHWHPVCSPLRVRTVTRNSEGENWGRLVEVTDADHRVHRWAMPASMLASVLSDAYREVLLSMGARLEPGRAAATALHRYLLATTDFEGTPLPRAIVASRLGWHDQAFVLPRSSIGGDEAVVYQSTSNICAAVRAKGTLQSWQSEIAAHAEINSRIALSICAALAAPLLQPLGCSGAGIHFRGGSSIGKTTTLNVAGSVWGGPCDRAGLNGYIQTWQATANGIEGMAQAHCDLPLCLDEMGLVRGEDASRVAYQLASGIGRTRAQKSGLPAPRLEWRVMLLSTGELSLADKIAEGGFGRRAMAGQEVRLIDIPADAEQGFGIFDDAPQGVDLTSKLDRGRALSHRLNEASQRAFGTAGPAFVEAFLKDQQSSISEARRVRETFSEAFSKGADGQVQRVCLTFGLIAAAGELAISYGVLPWKVGAAIKAAQTCFQAWRMSRGSEGAFEVQSAIAHLRGIIERDGSARFQRIGNTNETFHDRLGYIRNLKDDTEYLIQAETWKQIFAGRDAQRMARELADHGILRKDGEGRSNRKERINGARPERVYVVSHSALFDDGERDG